MVPPTEAARRGKLIVGIDSSAEMLGRCRERAEAAGVADRLTLIQADFRVAWTDEVDADGVG